MKTNSTKLHDTTFNKVLFVGPDINDKGGISSVLKEYSSNFEPFHYIPTNSPNGTLPGLLKWGALMLRLPIERIKGRKLLHLHYAGKRSWPRKVIIAKWGRLLGFKIIMHCHTNIHNISRQKGEQTVGKELRKADHNIVLAKSYLNYVTSTLNATNSSIVNNIMPSKSPLQEKRLHAPITFLFLGLIVEAKGIYDLLEAAKMLRNEGFNFKIIIGGIGEVDKMNELIRNHELSGNIDYRGWVTGKDKDKAFDDSDILALPSYSEAMPVSILEAMSHGMPVIATEVGAIPDMISNGGNGILFHPGDVNALASAMRHYLKDSSLIQSEGNASRKQVRNYSAESVMKQLVKIYQTILK